MRTEQEMLSFILNFAKGNAHIRAAYMNGSRANPNVEKDRFQDFDIVYVADETAPPFNSREWIEPFGDIAVMQEPDLNDLAWGAAHDFNRSYSWQLLFYDGNRIDLTVCTKEVMRETYPNDSLTVPLLDKDGCLPPIPEASDKDYHVKPPTEGQYYDTTNNFWWCLQNVAKGIARDQLTYAMNMYIQVVHEKLECMVNWYVGIRTGFSVSVGSWGKYYKKYLPADIYTMYAATYADGNYENLWEAVFTACKLFGTLSVAVGNSLHFPYNQLEEDNMMDYLMNVRRNL